MAQHDFVIDNQSFPSFRSDLNSVLQAIVSNNSGTSEPSTTFANQLFYNSSTNVLSIRNEDNDAFIPLMQFDQSADVAATLATVIDILDASGTDQAGTSLTIRGGAGTGTGSGGSIIFATADGSASTGSGVNAHATRVTITDDGKVGIGITAAEAVTHIAGATADADGALGSQSPQLIIEGGNNNNPFELGMDNSGATAVAFLQSRNKSAGAQFLSLNPAGGNVGVGTAAPATAVDIHGDSHSLRLTDTDTALSDNELSSQIEFFQSDASGAGVKASIGAYGDGTTGSLMLRFAAGDNTERMRIESDGDIYINRTTHIETTRPGKVVLGFAGGSDSGIEFVATGNVVSTQAVFYNNTGNRVGTITTSNSATGYNTTSDYRLKENVTNLTGAIERVKTLLPKRFNFIVDPDTTVDGFLAHEVTAVPEAVTGTHNEVDENGDPVYQGIDQSKLVPVLTAALQEAIAKIEALETRVAALEG
tara:strand:+ start:4323 stop:5756 length:1434 start_codon:yes stop_codon:yes gene_type:complete